MLSPSQLHISLMRVNLHTFVIFCIGLFVMICNVEPKLTRLVFSNLSEIGKYS